MIGDPINNLWVVLAALLVFTMTISVGLLEVGELGEALYASLMKTVLMTSIGLFVMAIVGFNTAFAPTLGGGVIGNPLYRPGLFLGSFAANPATAPGTVWWSMGPSGSAPASTRGRTSSSRPRSRPSPSRSSASSSCGR